MAYPGIALVAMVGLGLGFALWYLLADNSYNANHSNYEAPTHSDLVIPNTSWNETNQTRQRRRRKSNGRTHDDCSICSEPLVQSVSVEQCGHHFHNACIAKWRNVQATQGVPPVCPNCRRRI